ncbi:MAG TPA: hypothetical protein DEQ34_09335 [Balneolaceae bacterium]|nr:hypothetical protein [Balneolaceae bacterium]|tara:strand:+ start:2155 stop:2754 length:600 start_codon:yes stop_codon:yes gene_type:complete
MLAMGLPVSAQQSDQIVQLPPGDIKFAKGKIIVELADTVTSGFVEYQFKRLGYEILELKIAPLYGRIPQKLSNKQLTDLLYHPYIQHIEHLQRTFDEERFLASVKEKNMNPDDSLRYRNFLIRIAENAGYVVTFEEDVTTEMAETFSATQPELTLNVLQRPPNMVVVKTEPGKEKEVMDDLELLVYVTNTAMITLQNQD